MTDGMSDDERKYFAMHPSGGASHGEEEAEIPLTPIDRPLDLATVRAKLHAKSGKQYWRTLDELADDPHFDELMHREFPRHASEWDESVDRRNFLKLMGASLAFAGLAGCKSNEQEAIIPYVKQPDGMVLGRLPRRRYSICTIPIVQKRFRSPARCGRGRNSRRRRRQPRLISRPRAAPVSAF